MRTPLANRAISFLDYLADNAVTRIRRLQGKGAGSESCELEVRLVLAFARSLGLKNLVALDVGANIGLWSQEFLSQERDARIVCFEPGKVTFERLKQNSSLHGFDVQLENIALGANSNTAVLYYDEAGSGLASLSNRRLDHAGRNFSGSEQIAVETLDAWCARSGVKPNILKLDVEGHELDVLLGGRKSLQEISIIQFEFGGTNIDSRTFWQDFWYFFKEARFRVFRVTPWGAIEIFDYRELDETFLATNYIAVRF